MSDGPSIRYHRITMTCFRTCSPCQARSQARLCLCTSGAMSDRAKRTFELLRYALGGDRPSQTAYHGHSQVKPGDFTTDTTNRLRTLYAQ